MNIIIYYRYALMYTLCVAIVAIYRQYLMNNVPPVFILCMSSAISIVYFHSVNILQLKTMYQKIFGEKILFFKLNIIVALIWISAFYSIFYSSATLYTYEYFLVGACISLIFNQDKSKKNMQLCAHIFFIIVPYFLFDNYLKGIFLGQLAGSLGYLYNQLSSKICHKLDLSSTQILASRFWCLFVVSIIWVKILPNFVINEFQLWNVVGLAFLSFVFQVWLNQQSLLTVGAKKTSYICGLVPLITFLFQGALLHQWTSSVFVLSLIAGLLISFVLLLQRETI